ncbi:phenmedipham hydrolase [Plectosphaerella plurivora]|uniref:Carboxylic ester hydrolase n=1 Tax=Plectosphaerella plurivora TaxID=936078 RepID=A0A9P9A7N0_9PEZI|nr:phenmedipham hydrolase [Plectosphaerella plurivora]
MDGPTVQLRQGTYRGLLLTAGPIRPSLPKAVEAYRGIPYARVASGAEGRFRPASSVPQGTESFDATRHGPLCPTFASSMDEAEGWAVSEDCLNADIYRPVMGSGADIRVPVVIYVHGGGFNFGKGAERDMASFVGHASRDVVAVTFNYRLGPLGFLSSGIGESEGCLNLGLRDQKMLLEWVRDNIHAFGGDAGNVTLMGVSAGAHSIGHHMLSAVPVRPLFHKAILESGASTARSILAPTHERQESQFKDFLRACGISSQLTPKETLDQLRSAPLKAIREAASAVWLPNQDSLRWPFQPVIDGRGGIVPDIPVHLTTSSPPSGALIPVITGFNSHEGAMFLAATRASTIEDFKMFFKSLIPGLSTAQLEQMVVLYPDPVTAPSGMYLPQPPNASPQFCRLAAAYADQAYIAPLLLTAHRNAQAGEPVHVYEFAARGEPFAAANHGSEGDIVAHDLRNLGAHRGLVKISEVMHGLFAQFVASSPGKGGLVFSGHKGTRVQWPRFATPFADSASPEAGEILVFGDGNNERAGGISSGTPTSVRKLSSLEIERCRFWWALMPLSQGMGRDER